MTKNMKKMMENENSYDTKNEMKHECKYAGHRERSRK